MFKIWTFQSIVTLFTLPINQDNLRLTEINDFFSILCGIYHGRKRLVCVVYETTIQDAFSKKSPENVLNDDDKCKISNFKFQNCINALYHFVFIVFKSEQ